MTSKEIAKTIHQQLIATTLQPVFWSWGASAFQSVTEENLKMFGIEKCLGGLKFKVNGFKFKGHIVIALNSLDYYNIYFGNIRKNEFKIKNSFTDISFDEMSDLIDDTIEKQENYKF